LDSTPLTPAGSSASSQEMRKPIGAGSSGLGRCQSSLSAALAGPDRAGSGQSADKCPFL
jgi:hypothetical protein